MNDKKNTDPIVPPMQSNPQHKSYYCPHCKKIIMKGNVKRLSMTCQHCSYQIDADEKALLISKIDQNSLK
jgi:DNA-directed RNA polymerase subunit RPC12/RpoP